MSAAAAESGGRDAGDSETLPPGPLLLLGAGRLASALLGSLHQAGFEVRLWARRPDRGAALCAAAGCPERFEPDRSKALAGAHTLVFCVADRAIEELARELAEGALPGEGARATAPVRCALHASGALGANALADLGRSGWSLGRMHPLVALGPAAARRSSAAGPFAGVAFSVTGEPAASERGRRLVAALGGVELGLRAEANLTRYHAAAALLSNGLVGLFDLAWEELAATTRDAEEARTALLVLLASTVENLAAEAPAQALTGPVVRGDADVVAAHLAALGPQARAAYATLGRRLLELARPGLDAERRRALERTLGSD